jgi:hypothetical protein
MVPTHAPQKRSPAGAGLPASKLVALLWRRGNLLLPGTLLVTVQAQLLAPFVFVDFGFAAFFQ